MLPATLPFVCFNEIEFHVGLAHIPAQRLPPTVSYEPQLIFSARRVKANTKAQKINQLGCIYRLCN